MISLAASADVAASAADVVHTHTHTRVHFSSASLFVAKCGGGVAVRWLPPRANSMRCIFNSDARIFSVLLRFCFCFTAATAAAVVVVLLSMPQLKCMPRPLHFT